MLDSKNSYCQCSHHQQLSLRQPPCLALTPPPSSLPPHTNAPNRTWQLEGELLRRDRELAKLVVRIMTLQEVLGSCHGGRFGGGGGGAGTAAHHAAAAAAARVAVAGLVRSSAVL
jgi:hypothetical protein